MEGCRPKFSLGLCLFEEGFDLDLFGFLIAIPFLDRWAWQPHEIMERWGFTPCGRTIQFYWGRHCKVWHLPWDFVHIKTDVLRPDGTWTKRTRDYAGEEPDGRELQTFDYTYTLRSGEIQNRKATVCVERTEWRWRCLKWCRWFARVKQFIWVDFDGEVGEGTGSWKGGTVGCGYSMLPGESAEQTLRRMERERKFNR